MSSLIYIKIPNFLSLIYVNIIGKKAEMVSDIISSVFNILPLHFLYSKPSLPSK